jgi:hypothetical protein
LDIFTVNGSEFIIYAHAQIFRYEAKGDKNFIVLIAGMASAYENRVYVGYI